MALTPKVLFIDAAYMKNYTSLNNSVNDAKILPALLLAHDKHLQSYLGTDLLNKLESDVSGATLSGNYETLMNEHVRHVVMWWTMVEVLPMIRTQVNNGGLMTRTSEDAQPSTTSEYNTILNASLDNAQWYTERMIDYLRHNTDLFSEYTSNTDDDISPNKEAFNDSGLTISSNLR